MSSDWQYMDRAKFLEAIEKKKSVNAPSQDLQRTFETVK